MLVSILPLSINMFWYCCRQRKKYFVCLAHTSVHQKLTHRCLLCQAYFFSDRREYYCVDLQSKRNVPIYFFLHINLLVKDSKMLYVLAPPRCPNFFFVFNVFTAGSKNFIGFPSQNTSTFYTTQSHPRIIFSPLLCGCEKVTRAA